MSGAEAGRPLSPLLFPLPSEAFALFSDGYTSLIDEKGGSGSRAAGALSSKTRRSARTTGPLR